MEEQVIALRNEIYQSNTARVELTSQMAQNADRQTSLHREQPLIGCLKLRFQDRDLLGSDGDLVGHLDHLVRSISTMALFNSSRADA